MFKDYQQFVLSKAAPPRPINERDFQLLHAALGLSTEFLELDVAGNSTELQEELGDLAWYMMLTAHAVDFPVTNLPDMTTTPKHPWDEMSTKLETFVSLVKKHCIYGSNKTQELPVAFHAMWRAFLGLLEDHQIQLDVLIAENQDKLNKRYAAAFTTQESEDRKDKQ
jgi:hypothetical protein